MRAAAAVRDVSKRHGRFIALDHVSFTVQECTILGLLGRNGAGKTTVMKIITGQEFASSGEVEVFGERPHENPAVLGRTCLARESQAYPASFRVRHVIHAAAMLLPRWDERSALSLPGGFELPAGNPVRKLSGGMLYAAGSVLGDNVTIRTGPFNHSGPFSRDSEASIATGVTFQRVHVSQRNPGRGVSKG